MSEHFESWWQREGKSFDPDTEDVPWFDKRKELARKAFDVAMAISQNYVVNRDTYPTEVTFENGRRISLIRGTGHLAVECAFDHSDP